MLNPTLFRCGAPLLIVALIGMFSLSPKSTQAQENANKGIPPLTESQKEAIRKQIEELQVSLKTTTLQRNGSAEQVFLAASADPKKALELYLRCYQEVNFNRLGKSDSDFREWKERQRNNHESDIFLGSLQYQLRYLSLSARAAQQETISAIFKDLTDYAAHLQKMEDPPHPLMGQSIDGTVFAEVYGLEEALKRNEDAWELVPVNVGGIYEKTILPFLRETSPDRLKGAWEARIQQEASLAAQFMQFEEDMERYMRRQEDMGGRDQRNRMQQFVRNRALQGATFQQERLPALQWGSFYDHYLYVDRAYGAKYLLDHLQANVKHPQAPVWITQLKLAVADPDAVINERKTR